MIGIIGAMDSEVSELKNSLENSEITELFGLSFCKGKLFEKDVVVVKSGIGKVNSALCAQLLVTNFGVNKIINTGIAGALGEGLGVFDFVVSTGAVFHDVDVRVFDYKIGQIPGLPQIFESDKNMVNVAINAFKRTSFSKNHKIQAGLIASGDQFISSNEQKSFIKENFLPLCAEMEGASIAQASYLCKIPFVIVRCLSDMADSNAENIYTFNENEAAKASSDLVKEMIKDL